MRPFEEYQRELVALSAGEALDILIGLKAEKEQIIVKGGPKTSVITTPMRLCFKVPRDQKAVTIGPLQFCGGPPGQYSWIEGSLGTMVMDKVMHHDATEEARTRIYGTKIAVKVPVKIGF